MTSKTITISVRGTRYYQCTEALRSGKLVLGASARLRHEPLNPTDANAVAVFLSDSEHKLGHVSKELAPKFVKWLKTQAVQSVRVSKIGTVRERHTGSRPQVHLTVVVSEILNPVIVSEISHPISMRTKAPRPGVYWLACKKAGRIYVGESFDIDQRWKQHFSDLAKNRHANEAMQNDYSKFGRDSFQCAIKSHEPDETRRLEGEAVEIARLLAKGMLLYNMTLDGKGRTSDREFGDGAAPVSDRSRADKTQIAISTSAPAMTTSKAAPQTMRRKELHSGWVLLAAILFFAWLISK